MTRPHCESYDAATRCPLPAVGWLYRGQGRARERIGAVCAAHGRQDVASRPKGEHWVVQPFLPYTGTGGA